MIDIQLTPADLRHPPHGWEQVAADIASQVAKQPPPQRWRQRDTEGRLNDHGYTSRSFPAEEAAFIRARDVTCQTPGCQRPAKTCDLDHVVEHAKGGPSHRGNGQARCVRHHHLRDLPGVTITMADDGTTTITLPNGTTYTLPPDQNLNLIHDGDGDDGDGDGDGDGKDGRNEESGH